MAAIDTNRSAFASTGGASFFTAITSAFTAWNEARQTRKVLGQLTDRELDDIGLCRGDIDSLVG